MRGVSRARERPWRWGRCWCHLVLVVELDGVTALVLIWHCDGDAAAAVLLGPGELLQAAQGGTGVSHGAPEPGDTRAQPLSLRAGGTGVSHPPLEPGDTQDQPLPCHCPPEPGDTRAQPPPLRTRSGSQTPQGQSPAHPASPSGSVSTLVVKHCPKRS